MVGKICGINCEKWGKVRGSEGCTLIPEMASDGMPSKPCDIPYYVRKGFRCFGSRFPSYVSYVTPDAPTDIAEVQIATVHYNPTRAKRLADTFYEWRDSLGGLVKRLVCYELVFDDHEPEIEGSVVLRADSSASLMWQKEALLNRALADCGSRYFAWIDHDICIQSPTWLVDAIELLNNGRKAVQLFSTLTYLARDYKEIRTADGRVAGYSGAPGGAWIATTDYLRSLGGFYPFSVVGSGDEWFYAATTGNTNHTERHVAKRLSQPLRDEVRRYIANGNGDREDVGYVDSHAYHLWHGDRENRQYQTRELILQRHNFDPATDVRVRPDGVLEWASDKSQMHAEIQRFFVDRRDDG